MPELGWLPRRRPLPAEAAIACGRLSAALGRRLLEDARASRFRAAAAGGCLLIAGSDLPWMDGIVYLGVDRGAPSLWLPTQLQPDFPLDLLEAAIRRLGQPLPCVVLPFWHPSGVRNQEGEGVPPPSGGGVRGRPQPPATLWHPPGADPDPAGGPQPLVTSSPGAGGADPDPVGVPDGSRWLHPSAGATTGNEALKRFTPLSVRGEGGRGERSPAFEGTVVGGSGPFLFSAHDLRPLDLEMLAAWLSEQDA
jgi:hypothetical protein